MIDTTDTVSEVLDKRWDNPRIGSVAMHNRLLHRKDPKGWVPTHRKSDQTIYRLQLATGRQGLWRTDATARIGLDLVIDAVEAARTEPLEMR